MEHQLPVVQDFRTDLDQLKYDAFHATLGGRALVGLISARLAGEWLTYCRSLAIFGLGLVAPVGLTTIILATFFNPVQSQEVFIRDAKFLVFLRDGQGSEQIFQSDLVPLIPNRVCYGWRIRLADAEGLVRFKEIFSLPAEPEFWSGENDEFSTSAIAKDRITSVTERFTPLQDGWIGNSWCVADGDPKGKYSMEVHINGQFAKRFDFQLRDVSVPSND